MKINKIFLIIVILLIAFTSSACNETKKAPEPVEIHIQFPVPKSWAGTDEFLYTEAIKNFQKLNPLITVILDYWPESMIQNVEGGIQFSPTSGDFIKLLEGEESPDIIGVTLDDLQTIGEKELLFDLLKISGSEEIDINKSILDLAMVNGELLTLPYSATPNAMLYNKDLFDEADIPYPQGDWTWEQFREISKVVNPTINPLLIYDIGTLSLLMQSIGKDVVASDGTTSVGYMDSPEAIRSLQWLNAYYHDSGQNTVLKSWFDYYNQFESYQDGMFVGNIGLSFQSPFTGNNASKLGVAPLPRFADGVRANPTTFKGFSISHNSKHPQEAWEFIKYLTLSKNSDSIKFVKNSLTTSKLMSEATGQSADPVKRIYMGELDYATNSFNSQFIDTRNGDKDLSIQFEKLLTTKDEDIPAKLHELALKFDQALISKKEDEIK